MKLPAIAVACSVALFACGDDGPGTTGTLIGSCAAAECADGQDVLVTLDHPDGLSFTDGKSALLRLYGYDPNLADAAASTIVTFETVVDELPATLALVLPAEPHLLIDQGNGAVAEGQAGYYFSLLDGDDPCEHVMQNFQISEPEFFSQEIPDSVVIQATDVCRD